METFIETLADLQSEDPDIDLDLIDDNLLSISEVRRNQQKFGNDF